MKKALLLITFSLMILASACKLDAPVYPTSNNGPNNSGSDSFQPVTAGTYWRFNGDVGGVPLTQTITMTGATEMVAGKLFYVGTNVMGGVSAANNYYHGGGNYILRGTSLGGGITLDFVYLIDDMTVGRTWTARLTADGTVNTVPAQFVGKLVEANITRTISGKSFTDVVHTQGQLQYNLTGTMETFQTYDFYIARGVGLIQIESSTNTGIKTVNSIAEYSIK